MKLKPLLEDIRQEATTSATHLFIDGIKVCQEVEVELDVEKVEKTIQPYWFLALFIPFMNIHWIRKKIAKVLNDHLGEILVRKEKMICPKCDSENTYDGNDCHYCGYRG